MEGTDPSTPLKKREERQTRDARKTPTKDEMNRTRPTLPFGSAVQVLPHFARALRLRLVVILRSRILTHARH